VPFLGDSYTEGLGVAYPQTFAGRLASRLDSDRIDLLNGAVASCSPIIYWRTSVELIEPTTARRRSDRLPRHLGRPG